jgi:hypothetical protein
MYNFEYGRSQAQMADLSTKPPMSVGFYRSMHDICNQPIQEGPVFSLASVVCWKHRTYARAQRYLVGVGDMRRP